MSRDGEEFREAGPAPGAEQMFADDPEMLALIAKGRARQAEPGPRRKPWWYQAVLIVLGLIGAAAGYIPVLAGVVQFHPVLIATGLFGGMSLALGILGHRPGYYAIRDAQGEEIEKATLWKPLPMLLRLGAFATAIAAPALGVGLLLLQ